jgi:FKBP-type peptidyl-prolyl cis-trans isomerase FkpA
MRTRTTINFIFFSFAAAALITSCGGPSGDFKTDATTGVQYRFINHDENGTKPTEGDVVHVAMVWSGKNSKGDADSVFRNSHLKNQGDTMGTLPIQLRKSFNGCLEQGIMMMAKGDSAVFQVNSDSLYHKTFRFPADRPLPSYVKSNPTFTFYIKLVSFQSQQEMMAERQGEMQKRAQEAQVRKAQEPADIAAYLQKNNLNVKPDADSIFYLQKENGKGRQVKEGDSVEISSTGMFLDGQIFDKSDKGPGHATYKFLYTQNTHLIQGWIKILGKMHEGEKVKVLIPSSMAYGMQGNQGIMPYTPLIFDIELVKITSNK